MVWLGPENEAYPPAQEAPAGQSPRLPCPHGVTRRGQGDQGPPPQGPPSPDSHLQPTGAVARTSSGGEAALAAASLSRLRPDTPFRTPGRLRLPGPIRKR